LRILKAYETYDYGTIFQALNTFTTVDLSSFYADRLEGSAVHLRSPSRERRAGQTAMYIMADGLTRLMAPVLSFTADELWRYLPARREESVHMALFPDRADCERLPMPS
jgi:isoleucyl-tRNA synthetase